MINLKNLFKKEKTNKNDNILFPIDDIINWTFPGITISYRDCNLDLESLKLYNIGQIIRSDTFVDTSHIIGKLLMDVRFTIFSSKTANWDKLDLNSSHYPLNTINANSYFKVIDIFKLDDKHLISLLHIPLNGIALFENKKNTFKFPQYEEHIENVLINKAREKFINSKNTKVIPEFEESEWLKRTNWAVGLDINNKLNPIKPISNLNRSQFDMYKLIRKITEDDFINLELMWYSFDIESEKQNILSEKTPKTINLNVLISLHPLSNTENRFHFIASELISSDGMRKVTIAEKELVITEIGCNMLTFHRIENLNDKKGFSLDITFKEGKVDMVIINRKEAGIEKKTQFIIE